MSRGTFRTRALLPLRPGIQNPLFWRNELLNGSEWVSLRKRVLLRDNHRCRWCGHSALKYMNVHHRGSGVEHNLRNLVTCCVACHAVMHIGRNLDLGTIEIWQSPLSQLTLLKRTRSLVKKGLGLKDIKKSFHLERGEFPCKSMNYANALVGMAERLSQTRRKAFITLPEPYCAIFVKFSRWQIE